jgi:beta-lactamase superfamily II metal-dependent hydrolase
MEREEELNIIISDTFQHGTLKIKRITLSNSPVKNTFFSEPYVVLKLKKFNEKTKKMKAEDDVTWNFLDFQLQCDLKSVEEDELIVEVWSSYT